jgi:DNA-binding transcriptional LysR family regulator
MYSPATYLGSIVHMILERAPAPLNGTTVVESDMPDVLRTLALSGQGYAFLPECTAATAHGGLAPVGDDRWSHPLLVVAFKSRGNKRPATQRLWSQLKSRDGESVVQQRRSLRLV